MHQTVRTLRKEENSTSLSGTCDLFGYSRQAYYHYNNKEHEANAGKEIILEYIREIRKFSPKMGARKLLIMIQSQKRLKKASQPS